MWVAFVLQRCTYPGTVNCVIFMHRHDQTKLPNQATFGERTNLFHKFQSACGVGTYPGTLGPSANPPTWYPLPTQPHTHMTAYPDTRYKWFQQKSRGEEPSWFSMNLFRVSSSIQPQITVALKTWCNRCALCSYAKGLSSLTRIV